MTDTLKVRDARDVENAVQWALGEGRALEILGQGSKRSIGRPPQTDLALDLSALSGVTLYEPEELVLRQGRHALSEIEAVWPAGGARFRADGLRTSWATRSAAAPSEALLRPICGAASLAGSAHDHLWLRQYPTRISRYVGRTSPPRFSADARRPWGRAP